MIRTGFDIRPCFGGGGPIILGNGIFIYSSISLNNNEESALLSAVDAYK